MKMRDIMRIVESVDFGAICDEMESAAQSLGVSGEFSSTDPDDSVYMTIAGMPLDADLAIVINQIDAVTPRQGDGTRAMQVICKIADNHGLPLVLEPFSGRTPTQVLKKWYAKFGFQMDESGWMYRNPRQATL